MQRSAVQHKALLMGDSHFKGSAMKVGNLLSAKFEVNGMIKHFFLLVSVLSTCLVLQQQEILVKYMTVCTVG